MSAVRKGKLYQFNAATPLQNTQFMINRTFRAFPQHPENSQPEAKTASANGHHRDGVRISTESLPMPCLNRENSFRCSTHTINGALGWGGVLTQVDCKSEPWIWCSLSWVITRWQQVMKLIDLLFSECNEQHLNITVGWHLFPALRCHARRIVVRATHTHWEMKSRSHTHASYTHAARIFTSNI